ncbi:MAG: anaerobic ribonucleoside-triphosphate reductase activating protein [Negativicutes bacterium]|jgi:anaerobic ribonucleoside-triphosphate reductase activating protein
MSIRIAGIITESVVDGPGLRLVIFCQGCYHNCPGCHNPDTHDFYGGTDVKPEQLLRLIDEAPLIRGVTFSGGEPMLQAEQLLEVARYVKFIKKYDLVTYTGFVYEDLLRIAEENTAVSELLQLTDWLIDGPYIEKERDISIAFRGSRNQRIIDVQRSAVEKSTVVVEF